MVAIENENKPELIRIFLEAYYQSKLAELVNLTVRSYNVTPLILAIQRKVDIDIIHQLVNAGADVNEKKDKTYKIRKYKGLYSSSAANKVLSFHVGSVV